VRWRKKSGTSIFILVHSIIKLHPVYQDNLSMVSTIFKSFTNHTPRLHFWTKIPQKSSLTPYKNHTHRHGITPSKQQRHKNYKTWWWLSLANHTRVLQPNPKPKCLKDQLRSSIYTLQLRDAEREFSSDAWQVFTLKNSESCLCARKHNLYSLV